MEILVNLSVNSASKVLIFLSKYFDVFPVFVLGFKHFSVRTLRFCSCLAVSPPQFSTALPSRLNERFSLSEHFWQMLFSEGLKQISQIFEVSPGTENKVI